MTNVLDELEKIIQKRRHAPVTESYVSRMLKGPEAELYRKVPEEATELLLSCVQGGAIASEAADLLFHIMLLLAKHNIPLSEVTDELQRRRNNS